MSLVWLPNVSQKYLSALKTWALSVTSFATKIAPYELKVLPGFFIRALFPQQMWSWEIFFSFNWFRSGHVQLYFCTLLCPLDGF